MEISTSDSSELIRAYAARGDQAAFCALVDRHLPLVFSTALRQVGGNSTLAEEVAQDVFIALARKSRTLVERPTLTPWLFSATRLSAINKLRREQRRLEREQKAYVMQQIEPGSETIDWQSLRPVIDDLLSQLPSRDQETLFMRFFEDRTFAQIGARLQITEDGARLRTSRAIDKINSLLARRGIQSTAAMLGSVLSTQQACAIPAGLAASTASAVLSASAAATGGAVTTHFLLSTMNASPVVIGSLVALAVVGLGSAWHQTSENRRTTALIANLREERTALQHEMIGLRERMGPGASASNADTVPRPVPKAAKEPSTAATSTPLNATSAAPSSVDALLRQVDHVLAHPELRPTFVAQVVQQLWGNDQRLFKSLGISPGQEEAIQKEARDYANMLLDARAKRVGGEDFGEMFAAADEYSFSQVKKILGEDAFAQLKQLKASGRENTTVDQLASRLYFTDSPLTREQALQLTRILVQHRFSADNSATIAGEAVSASQYSAFRDAQSGRHQETRVALVTDAAIAHAEGSLPGSTVTALKDLQNQQIIQIRLMTLGDGKQIRGRWRDQAGER